MKKLTKSDVILLGEGKQIRIAINKVNDDLQSFYYSCDIPIAYSTFRSYLSKDKIISDTFKICISKFFDVDYAKLAKPKVEQVKEFASSIHNDIKAYTSDEDLETFKSILELCLRYKLTLETSMVYRAMARNFYYRHLFNNAVEYYQLAIDSAPILDKSFKVFLNNELADIYTREKNYTLAKTYFENSKQFIDKYKINNESLFFYNYYKGIYYYSIHDYTSAKEHFDLASITAESKLHKAVALSNIGLLYKKGANYQKALDLYLYALDFFGEDNLLGKSSIYNNIAEVYRLMGDLENAMIYINKSIHYSKHDNSLDKRLFQTATLTQIQLQMGINVSFDNYYDALLNTKNKYIDKIYIINSINNMCEILLDKEILYKISTVAISLMEATDNQSYKDELLKCIGLLHVKIYKLGGK